MNKINSIRERERSLNWERENRIDGLEISEIENNSDKLPESVNWHLWKICNYGCKFCFARFEEINQKKVLKKERAMKIPKLLLDGGAKKLTFVGGEPTLCPHLGELINEAKKVGLTTCIVSNGTELTEGFLEKWNHVIDWIGLSIDASNDEMHVKMGRGLKGDISKDKSNHLKLSKEVWNRCRKYDIRMKLNTVVSKTNLEDNMTKLVMELRPDRWKIFEVLSVKGQNDAEIGNLRLAEKEFEKWIKRHSWVAKEGIPLVPESNELMRGSYAMLDPLGRFYNNEDGGHTYTESILENSVESEWKKNVFNRARFLKRGGLYDWDEVAI